MGKMADRKEMGMGGQKANMGVPEAQCVSSRLVLAGWFSSPKSEFDIYVPSTFTLVNTHTPGSEAGSTRGQQE